MYVTKTIANLTTGSRKPENYNGTITFEIDIMKNSSPIDLNLCQTWLFHKFFDCFFCFDLLWSWAVSAVSPAEKKMWILNWVGMSFSWYQSQKQWCHCNPPVFYYMWLSSQQFWWHTWNIYYGPLFVATAFLTNIAQRKFWLIFVRFRVNS